MIQTALWDTGVTKVVVEKKNRRVKKTYKKKLEKQKAIDQPTSALHAVLVLLSVSIICTFQTSQMIPVIWSCDTSTRGHWPFPPGGVQFDWSCQKVAHVTIHQVPVCEVGMLWCSSPVCLKRWFPLKWGPRSLCNRWSWQSHPWQMILSSLDVNYWHFSSF